MPQNQEEVQQFVQNGPNPSQSDKATQILSDLFGGEWWKILWSGEVNGEPSLLFPILEVFNSVVLIAVAILLVYIVGHAFVGSAHEGTPLGNRMHTIWVPIRAVLSMSLLAPIPGAKGLCVIQGIVLAFVGFSIQLGNMVATTGTQYLSQHQGQVITQKPDNLEKTGEKLAHVALQNYAVQYHQFYFQDKQLRAGYTVDVSSSNDSEDSGFISSVKNVFTGNQQEDETKRTTITYKFNNPDSISEDAMGSVQLVCSDSNSQLCDIRRTNIERMFNHMEKVASTKIRQIAGKDEDIQSSDYIQNVISMYGEGMTNAVRQVIDQNDHVLKEELELFRNQIREDGFIVLGSYFWTVQRLNNSLRDMVQSNITVQNIKKSKLKEQISPQFNQMLTNVAAITSYFDDTKSDAKVVSEIGVSIDKDAAENDLGYIARKTNKLISGVFSGTVNSFMQSISSTDPVGTLASWGHKMLEHVFKDLFPGLLSLHAIPYVGKAALSVILFAIPPLIILGFTLAYYLPAVPFIIWISSAMGWLLMVVEAMIAAPIWAAMHANPDGEGLAGESGSQGYTLFLQVLMRPPLMVIGFFFALLAMSVIGYFGNLFTVFFTGMSAEQDYIGLITTVAGIFLGGTVMVILTHKAFSMIHAIPEGLMKWMGAKGSHISSHNEQGDVGETRQVMVGAVASRTGEGGGKMGGKAMQSGAGAGSDQSSGDDVGSSGSEMSANAKNTADDHETGETPVSSR